MHQFLVILQGETAIKQDSNLNPFKH